MDGEVMFRRIFVETRPFFQNNHAGSAYGDAYNKNMFFILQIAPK
jgi:hypothetical protein